jgi:hypothetical protein
MEDYKSQVRNIFTAIFENPEYDEAAIHQYFSEDYIQHVDGNTLHFEQFKQHIKVLKEAVAAISITFQTIIQENNIVFTNHLVTATTKEQRSGQVQVISEFHFKDGKINYCSELTHMISGDTRDRDLGSRH